jgi:hypothetical protein
MQLPDAAYQQHHHIHHSRETPPSRAVRYAATPQLPCSPHERHRPLCPRWVGQPHGRRRQCRRTPPPRPTVRPDVAGARHRGATPHAQDRQPPRHHGAAPGSGPRHHDATPAIRGTHDTTLCTPRSRRAAEVDVGRPLPGGAAAAPRDRTPPGGHPPQIRQGEGRIRSQGCRICTPAPSPPPSPAGPTRVAPLPQRQRRQPRQPRRRRHGVPRGNPGRPLGRRPGTEEEGWARRRRRGGAPPESPGRGRPSSAFSL